MVTHMTSRLLSEREPEGCRLYLITPPKFEPRAFADELKRALDGGDVASSAIALERCERRRNSPRRRNPDADRAEAPMSLSSSTTGPISRARSRCDGVHIGQEDATYAEARAAVGPNGDRRRDLPRLARPCLRGGRSGRGLCRLRRVLSDRRPKKPKTSADIELLQWWAETMTVPCVAIGGITVENAQAADRSGRGFHRGVVGRLGLCARAGSGGEGV